MAGNEVSYTFVNRGTLFLPRGRACVTSLRVERAGVVVAPEASGSTYALVDRSGTELVSEAVTVVSGVAQVALTALDLPDTLPLGVGYAEHWGLEIDGVVRPHTRQAVVARFELHPPISQQDLLDEYPDLLVDLRQFASSLQPWMDRAWQSVTRDIVRHGDFPDIICESSDIYDWYEQSTFERIFRSLAKAQPTNARWQQLWDHHKQMLSVAKSAARILPDRDRDGIADSQGREGVARTYHVNVPPNRYPRRDPRW